MDLTGLFDQARDHYVEQFEEFVDRQNEACRQGHAEVKFQLSAESGLHERLAIVDFIKSDDHVEAVEFVPERLLQFDKVSGALGKMRVVVEALRWDNAVLHYDSRTSLQLDSWFEQWFDPTDRRHVPDAKLGLVIHSLSVQPGILLVDLGTAPGKALWRLLEEMERAGIDQVVINSDVERRH